MAPRSLRSYGIQGADNEPACMTLSDTAAALCGHWRDIAKNSSPAKPYRIHTIWKTSIAPFSLKKPRPLGAATFTQISTECEYFGCIDENA